MVTIFTALAELISLASVLPFLSVLSDPAKVWQWYSARSLAETLGIRSPSGLVIPAAVIFALGAVVACCVRLANLWMSSQLAAAIGSDLSCEAYRRTLFQPYLFHVSNNSSTLIDSITGQIGATVSAITLLLHAVSSSLVSAALLLGLLLINWTVALAAAVLFGGAYVLIGYLSRRALTANSRLIHDSRKNVLKSLQEGFGAIRDILLDGVQDSYLLVYKRCDRVMRKASARNQFIPAFPRFSLEALGLLAISCFAAILVLREGSGVSVLPVLGAFALGAQRLLPSMQQAYSAWSALKGYSVDLSGALQALERPLPHINSSAPSFKLTKGINFHNVSFSYSGLGSHVLHELSFQIPVGQRVGFIGSTGSGKSTTVDLLMGLLAPDRGTIYLDGLNLHDQSHPENLLAWRAAIAHVPQSIYLSDGSIAENIAFGLSAHDIDLDRVRLAAQQAQIASFIESSPEGYESFVGERGIRLSGGQRQRLGIARALYKQSQVLILDEATSALDNETEKAVMDAIDQLDRKLTIVMIAHRLSTVSNCDRIIRLDQGRVVSDGPPSLVLAQTQD